MANKPLFSSTLSRRRSFSYNPQGEDQQNPDQHAQGADGNGKGSTSEPPPAKRSRTSVGSGDGNDEDIWDDDLDFTQADLDDIKTCEILASQTIPCTKAPAGKNEELESCRPSGAAYYPEKSRLKLSKDSTLVQKEIPSAEPFAKPRAMSLSRTISANSSSLSSGSLRSGNTGSVNYASSSSTSSSSLQPKSSASSHSRISTSISSDSSVDITHSKSAVSLQGILSPDTSLVSERSLSTSLMVEIEKSKEDILRLKKENENLHVKMSKSHQDVFVKEGEIKILRGNLQNKETEVTALKKERMQQLDEERRQQSERERNLRTELGSLQTQLQFSQCELRESIEKYNDLKVSSRMEPTSSTQSSQSPKRSPKPVRRIFVEEKSPKPGGSGFPTKHTFMSDETLQSNIGSSSPIKSRKFTVDTETMTLANEEASEQGQRVKPRSRDRFTRLSVSRSQGKLNGPELISQILKLQSEDSESKLDCGIVELLQIAHALEDLSLFQFDRDTSNSLLSPVRSVAKRRTSELKTRLSCDTKDELQSIVSPDNYLLAVRGVCDLLERPSKPPAAGEPSTISVLETEPVCKFVCSVSEDSDILFILPLLNDYLTCYIVMLNSLIQNLSALRSPSSSSSSGKTSSNDSSVESVTSSLNLLLRDSASYANNLEHLTLVALKVLNRLVHLCPTVVSVLLARGCDEEIQNQDVQNMEDDGQQKAVEQSCGDRPSSLKSNNGLSTVRKQISSFCILKTLFQLANPGREQNHLSSREIVVTSLDILIWLGKVSSEAQFTSLLPVLASDIVHNCLECEPVPDVICHGLQLLTQLARSEVAISTLCTHPDGCILQIIYGLCTNKFDNPAYSVQTQVLVYKNLLECLLAIVHGHKNAVVVILVSNCHCKFKVIKSLVAMMTKVLDYYKDEKSENCLQVLRNGMSFLHTLSQQDEHYTERHTVVEHQYVCLVRELTKLFESLEENTEETSILIDLWDDPDQSPESEEDELMQDS